VGIDRWRCGNGRNYETCNRTIRRYCICRGSDAGKALTNGGEAAVVESVKAASDVYTPVTGEVVEGNAAIVAEPALINQDPEGKGWFFKIKITSPDELAALMSKADYDKFVEENPS